MKPDCFAFEDYFYTFEGELDYDTALDMACKKFDIPVVEGEKLLAEANGNG